MVDRVNVLQNGEALARLARRARSTLSALHPAPQAMLGQRVRSESIGVSFIVSFPIEGKLVRPDYAGLGMSRFFLHNV